MNTYMKVSNKFKLLILTATAIAALSCWTSCAGLPGPTGQQGPSGPPGPAGVGITGASMNSANHLVITLSDGQTIDAGSVGVAQTITQTITMGELFSQIQPVIVRVDIIGPGFQGSGSGIIIRSDGYLLTNAHVIEGARSITITLSNDQEYSATVIHGDANIDLAILKLDGGPANLPAATLGSASDIAVGGVVVAAGFPLGSDLPGPASFTQGIISAVRTLGGQRYIQTDVQINPGSSGGALVTRSSGKLVGVTSAKLLPPGRGIVGIGLAIPIDVVQAYLQENLK